MVICRDSSAVAQLTSSQESKKRLRHILLKSQLVSSTNTKAASPPQVGGPNGNPILQGQISAVRDRCIDHDRARTYGTVGLEKLSAPC
jgi:hypothetical protein